MSTVGASETATPEQANPPEAIAVAKRDLALLCLAPLTLVFAAIDLARLGDTEPKLMTPLVGRPYVANVWTYTTHRSANPFLLGAVGVSFAALCLIWLSPRMAPKNAAPAEDVLRTRWNDPSRLWQTVMSFVGGVVIGALVRFFLGHIEITGFCNGSSPLIAGLVIGIVFQQTGPRAARRRAAPAAAALQRQLGVVYVLAGAVCAALGNISGDGWAYGSYFLVICGSLAASCYVVLGLVLDA